VTHGQCDARPTVTLPAVGHHCPVTGKVLGDRGTRVCEQLAQGRSGVETCNGGLVCSMPQPSELTRHVARRRPGGGAPSEIMLPPLSWVNSCKNVEWEKTFGLRRTVNVYVNATLVNFCIILEFLLALTPKIGLPSLQFKSGYVPGINWGHCLYFTSFSTVLNFISYRGSLYLGLWRIQMLITAAGHTKSETGMG